MVEGARLESVYTVKRIEGSNPSLSATRTENEAGTEAGFFYLRPRCLPAGFPGMLREVVRAAGLPVPVGWNDGTR